MYKDSNFFSIAGFFRFPLLFLSSSHSLALFLPFSFSLAHSLAPPSPHAQHARTHNLSFFLSSFLIHPFLSFSFKQILCHTLPLPLFLSMHLFLSLTRSHDRGQEVEVRELRSLDYCCVIATKFVSMTK